MHEIFHHIAKKTAEIVGSGSMFFIALLMIIGWGASGPWFGYSDTWQLFINTTTTIITFLTVVLIQNTQNRDSKAIHLKLDELIHAVGRARDDLLTLENLSEVELDNLEKEFERIREKALKRKK